jgi:hypothetical protein
LLCGSASTWIEKNILSSTGFLGRVSRTLTLEELPLQDCAKFWPRNATYRYRIDPVTHRDVRRGQGRLSLIQHVSFEFDPLALESPRQRRPRALL